MTAFVFPDTTVLRNFAVVRRIELLESILNGHGRWTAAVAAEVSDAVPYEPLMADLLTVDWLGEPIEIGDEALALKVLDVRRMAFGGTDSWPLKHLGEAETITLILFDPDFAGSAWVSDDRAAFRYARNKGIPTFDTTSLIGKAACEGKLDADEGFAVLQRMAACGRPVRIPATSAELTS